MSSPLMRRTIVELALVLPVMVLLVLFMLQLSSAYGRQQHLQEAADAGVRVAAHPTATREDIELQVRRALEGDVSDAELADATITMSPTAERPCEVAPTGSEILVAVSIPHQLSIPLLRSRGLTLTGTAKASCATGAGNAVPPAESP